MEWYTMWLTGLIFLVREDADSFAIPPYYNSDNYQDYAEDVRPWAYADEPSEEDPEPFAFERERPAVGIPFDFPKFFSV